MYLYMEYTKLTDDCGLNDFGIALIFRSIAPVQIQIHFIYSIAISFGACFIYVEDKNRFQ